MFTEYGGIYLDSDMVVIRQLDVFRSAEMVAGKAGSKDHLSNGVLIAVSNHGLMKVGQAYNNPNVWMYTALCQ